MGSKLFSLYLVINQRILGFYSDYFCWWVMPMTSSINVSKREPRNCFPWKSWDIIKNIIFSESDLLPHAIIEVRTFSVFTESHQMVRKSSIWLNQLSVEISTLKSEKNIFFALDILYCITHTRTFFFFSFSSHMTAKSTSKLIFL